MYNSVMIGPIIIPANRNDDNKDFKNEPIINNIYSLLLPKEDGSLKYGERNLTFLWRNLDDTLRFKMQNGKQINLSTTIPKYKRDPTNPKKIILDPSPPRPLRLFAWQTRLLTDKEINEHPFDKPTDESGHNVRVNVDILQKGRFYDIYRKPYLNSHNNIGTLLLHAAQFIHTNSAQDDDPDLINMGMPHHIMWRSYHKFLLKEDEGMMDDEEVPRKPNIINIPTAGYIFKKSAHQSWAHKPFSDDEFELGPASALRSIGRDFSTWISSKFARGKTIKPTRNKRKTRRRTRR